MNVRLVLRLDGLAIGAGAVVPYADGDHSWWLFTALILAPDVSFLAYAAGPRLGAAAYNRLHTFVLPIALGTAGVVFDSGTAVAVALIWLAHIGIDRAL